ncbi:MAG: hypothetical protein AAFV45_11010, partial [Pseudomonadota bacterium]
KENGNVVFLQRGRLMTQPSPRPSVTEFVQNYLPDLGQSAFLPTSAPRLPILGISPMQVASQPGCALPTRNQD